MSAGQRENEAPCLPSVGLAGIHSQDGYRSGTEGSSVHGHYDSRDGFSIPWSENHGVRRS